MKKMIFFFLSLPLLAMAQEPCESLLEKRSWFSPFYLSTHAFYRDELYKTSMWKPARGVGRLIQVEVVKVNQHWPMLIRTAEKFPEYFAQYDIYATRRRLIIPDSERLNSLSKNGVKFKDLQRLPFQSHFYSDVTFNKNFNNGYVLLASRGSYFYHDRMQDHMMGALMMPAWLYEKFKAYDQFKSIVVKMKANGNKKLADFLELEAGPMTTSGYYWDDLTGRIGRAVYDMAERPQVTAADVYKLRDIFYEAGVGFTPGLESYIGRNFVYCWRLEADKGSPLLAAVQKIADEYPTRPITKEFALEEALRLVHELSKTPIAELQQLLNL